MSGVKCREVKCREVKCRITWLTTLHHEQSVIGVIKIKVLTRTPGLASIMHHFIEKKLDISLHRPAH